MIGLTRTTRREIGQQHLGNENRAIPQRVSKLSLIGDTNVQQEDQQH